MQMSPGIDDQSCTIFCPFVLLAAIMCGSNCALVVAMGDAIACNTILMGKPYMFHFTRPEIESLGTFVAYSVFLIFIVQLFRLTAARSLRQAGAKERTKGIVFSSNDGQAWASWYGVDAPVRLGPVNEVLHMMEDFIAQAEVGKRLSEGLDEDDAPRRAGLRN